MDEIKESNKRYSDQSYKVIQTNDLVKTKGSKDMGTIF